MSYSNPVTVCHSFKAAAVNAAATFYITPPNGMQGRLRDITYNYTTAMTTAADALTLGVAGDTDAYGSLALPIGAINTGGSGATLGATKVIAADTVLTVTIAGSGTAGVANLDIIIDWY